MLPIFLLFLLFWSLGPGLLTLWVCRAGGLRPLAGLLSGLVFGPFAICGALFLVKILGSEAQARAGEPAGAPLCLSYRIPLVGRLHVSTVWGLAGLATFICAWGAGGLGYEMLRPPPAGGETLAHAVAAASPATGKRTAPAPAGSLPSEAQSLQANLARTQMPQATFLDSMGNQPKQARPAQQSPGSAAAGVETAVRAEAAEAFAARQEAAAPQNPPAPEPPTAAPAPAPTAVATNQTAVGEVVRLFGSNGHRVHASLSGAGRTTTLSVSGPTLTRGAGNQLLGNTRVRESLKFSGVRIVVLVNGPESWTFLL